MVFCEMTPRMGNSIVKVNDHAWKMGSTMICETNIPEAPSEFVASWTSEDGNVYYLRPSRDIERKCHTDNDEKDIGQADRVHQGGTSAAAWAIADFHVKVKAWTPELESEVTTIDFVRTNSGVPVPEVMHLWVDEQWNRSFLILKTIPGRTLLQAWPDMTDSQRLQAADCIAEYITELASLRSDGMETSAGRGIRDDWLVKRPPPEKPSWIPVAHGPFDLTALKEYAGGEDLAVGSEFYFYHADTGPTNIILDDGNRVIALIDWELAAYYPRFWIGTKVMLSAAYNLPQMYGRGTWAKLLTNALQRQGFEGDRGMFEKWNAAVRESKF